MAVKLSSRQQAQLAYLESLPPRFGRIYSVIEQMAGARVDESVVRGLTRLLDQIKGEAGALSLGALADTAGLMSTLARRGGGLQMKVRGLRELQGSLKINYEAALRSASTPEASEAPPAP
jgi:HPt (histidine-containing phosphotransfer) domain-containing protein